MGDQVAMRAQGSGDADAILARARASGVLGWVREDDGVIRVHAEGPADAVGDLLEGLDTEPAKVEGHEQFARRGVAAGAFIVQEHAATARHFDLRLEVAGVMRSWAVPKGPSMDPAVKRMAIQVEDHAVDPDGWEGVGARGGGAIVWDRGSYEQGGRVPWPEALERGHAVFVLHGEKLSGGFALQRTRSGAKPQWLLLKRRDDAARPGSDVTAERAESVRSGRTLDALLDALLDAGG